MFKFGLRQKVSSGSSPSIAKSASRLRTCSIACLRANWRICFRVRFPSAMVIHSHVMHWDGEQIWRAAFLRNQALAKEDHLLRVVQPILVAGL